MYSIAICDDEPIFVKQIYEMTSEILSAEGEPYTIYKFFSIAELKDSLDKTPDAFNILLLDILLKDMNGVKFAEHLRDIGCCVPVIFISSSEDYILDAYAAEPVAYVMKPIDREKLAEALKRAIKKLKPNFVILDTPSKTLSLKIQDLLFVEVYGKTLLLHMQDGTVTEIAKTLSSFSEFLPKDRFVQCHRSYIVALSAILSIKRFEITLKDNTVIPTSKYSYNTVQERLQQYAAKWF